MIITAKRERQAWEKPQDGEAENRQRQTPEGHGQHAFAAQGPQCQVVNWDSSEQPLDNMSCAALTRVHGASGTVALRCHEVLFVLLHIFSTTTLATWCGHLVAKALERGVQVEALCWQIPRNDDSGGPACDCSESAEFTSASLMTRGKKDAVSICGCSFSFRVRLHLHDERLNHGIL